MQATHTIVVDGRATRRLLRTFTLTQGHLRKRFERTRVVIGTDAACDLVVAGEGASRRHCELEATPEGYRIRDLDSTNGTQVNGLRVFDALLPPRATISLGPDGQNTSKIDFSLEDDEVEVPASPSPSLQGLVGASLAMRELYALIERLAPSDATVLIQGETGSGKERVAEAIHRTSARAQQPCVVFDCGAVAENLIESQLFGHERGAFTGADRRHRGCFAQAEGGTLFLDEIGELPLALQPKLLRVLESKTYKPLGAQAVERADVRIVAATHRPMRDEVRAKRFREDLYYRLSVITLEVPPLRARREDIPLLVERFLGDLCASRAHAARHLQRIDDSTWGRLTAHAWPGNVRELRNLVERACVLAPPDGPLDLRPGASGEVQAVPTAATAVDLALPFGPHKAALVAAFEQAYLRGQLERHGGNYSRAAAASELDRMYFKRMLQKYEG